MRLWTVKWSGKNATLQSIRVRSYGGAAAAELQCFSFTFQPVIWWSLSKWTFIIFMIYTSSDWSSSQKNHWWVYYLWNCTMQSIQTIGTIFFSFLAARFVCGFSSLLAVKFIISFSIYTSYYWYTLFLRICAIIFLKHFISFSLEIQNINLRFSVLPSYIIYAFFRNWKCIEMQNFVGGFFFLLKYILKYLLLQMFLSSSFRDLFNGYVHIKIFTTQSLSVKLL